MGWYSGSGAGGILPQCHHTPPNHEDRGMTIFVANLFWETTEAELEQLFVPYGVVERCQIITDRATGRSRGFGFVEMPNSIEADVAIANLNGTVLGGRPLTVSEARPREDRRPRDDRGGPRRPRW